MESVTSNSFVIHKPVNTVSSRSDSINWLKNKNSKNQIRNQSHVPRTTIYDIAEAAGFPTNYGLVGRLDYLTSGIMLMTKDSLLGSAIRDPTKEDEDEEEEELLDSNSNSKKRKIKHIHNDGSTMNDIKKINGANTCSSVDIATSIDAELGTLNEHTSTSSDAVTSSSDHQKDPDFTITRRKNQDIHGAWTPPADFDTKHKEKDYIVKVMSPRIYHEGEDVILKELVEPLEFKRFHKDLYCKCADIQFIRKYRDMDLSFNDAKPFLGWCLDLKITLREGKHHQIRRIMKRSKLTVIQLHRTRIASILSIDTIPEPGMCRYLTESELNELYAQYGIEPMDEKIENSI